MVSQIQLGNIFSSGGKTVIGGSSSGIDTESLLKGLVEAKRTPAVQLEKRLETNGKISTAYAEMQTILTRFKDASNFLRNPPGVQNADDNIFMYRTGNIGSNTSVSGDTYFTATVEPGTVSQNYTITEITSVALAKKQSTNNFNISDADQPVVYAAFSPPYFKAGTIQVNGEFITLEDGDTLREVAAKFNAVSADTGIAASMLKVADNQFKLVFTATETGSLADFDMDNSSVPGTVVDATGVLSGLTFTDTQLAANAEFKIDNVSISRQSNSIDDLVDGVTINLKQKMSIGDVTTQLDLNVQPDTELVKSAILNFVDAYNEFRLFAAKHQATDGNGVPTEDAVLSNSATLRSVISRIATEMGAAVQGITGTDPARLSDIGITFADFPGDAETPAARNILNVDEAKLESALSTNFDKVSKVFAFDMTSDSADLQIFSRTNALDATSFTLNINQTTNTYQAVIGATTYDLDYASLGSDGVTLKGRAGTPLEGLVMIFSSSANTSISVNMTQGIADRLFNDINGILAKETGLLSVEVENLSSANERLETEIAKIDEQIERFRDQMLEKFSRLEAALASINTLLASLDAQQQAQLANS